MFNAGQAGTAVDVDVGLVGGVCSRAGTNAGIVVQMLVGLGDEWQKFTLYRERGSIDERASDWTWTIYQHFDYVIAHF